MPNDQYITAEELEQRRPCGEYVTWYGDKLQEIGASKDGQRAFRERRGLLKEYVCEALAISTICDRFYDRSDSVFVTHVIGSQNYDATIEDQRDSSSGIRFLEITQASENFDSRHRMLYLNSHGSVPLFSELQVSRGEDGFPHVTIGEGLAMMHDQIVDRALGQILSAAEKKSVKSYPNDTSLVIVFDPGPAFRTADDQQKLKVYVEGEVAPMLSNFRSFFVSAGDAGYLWHFEP